MTRLPSLTAAGILVLLLAPLSQTVAAKAPSTPGAAPGPLPTHITVVIHGVNDDGKGWSRRLQDDLDAAAPADRRPEVYLFRWTQPDGAEPDLGRARKSVQGIEERCPDHPHSEAVYQVAVARRLRDFLVGARGLYREYGVDGRIDVVAHSQGTLIALEALDLGGDADNLLFMGSPLLYTGDRQDDVIVALPHVRGILFNYYTPSDAAIRFLGGGLIFEPRGWPQKGLPTDKVVQVRLNVAGHTGYYTDDAIRGNYLDKLGAGAESLSCLPPAQAQEFLEKWGRLVADANLIDPE